ncbi:MAG: OsmC family protein [Candidatus Neomarinimicrobiota bacterium]
MAISTMKVSGEMGKGFKTTIHCSQDFIIDQPAAMGGEGLGPNPMEVFLSTLPACICAIGRIISNQERLGVNAISVEVEGDIDKDVLLGKTEEGRAGFTEIRALVDIDADMTTEEKEAFLEKITKRCPIADNIINTTVVKETVK